MHIIYIAIDKTVIETIGKMRISKLKKCNI